jgi:hypothetical protein
LNFSMYVITASIAGWALNKNIDSSAGAGGYVGTYPHFEGARLANWWSFQQIISSHGVSCVICNASGNAATFYFLPMVLIASVVGLASTLAGIHHLRVWRTESLAAAASAALITWTLTLLAFG